MTVHLLNPLQNPFGGSEQRTLALYRLLRERGEVRLWSEQAPAPEFARHLPIHRIDEAAGALPEDGTLVVVGVYFDIGGWIERARPRRLVIVFNTWSHTRLWPLLIRLWRAGRRAVEIVFASAALQRSAEVAGVVQPSPIDLDRFRPFAAPPRPFTVGRHSRDEPYKHHPDDVALYRQLAAAGCHVRLMGATCLSRPLADVAGVELLPAGAEPAERFLRSLDCFIYRTADAWHEAFGRVVLEAMASGLPVLGHRRGGYTEALRPDQTGILFDGNDEALAAIARLRTDAGYRRQLGRAARAAVETMLSPAALDFIAGYYLNEPARSETVDLDALMRRAGAVSPLP